MRRPTHVCATCSEYFTRRYSATRHNLTIHNGIGEIVTYIEYLVGRSSGRYRPSHPSLYRMRRGEKRTHNFGHVATTVSADSIGDTFRHRGLQGQYHYYHYQQQGPSPSISLPSLPPPATQDVSPSQSTNTTNDHGILSQEIILKIRELKRLVYSNPQYCPNPDAFIKSIIYFCNDGNNTFLDEKLEELRTMDVSKYWVYVAQLTLLEGRQLHGATGPQSECHRIPYHRMSSKLVPLPPMRCKSSGRESNFIINAWYLTRKVRS